MPTRRSPADRQVGSVPRLLTAAAAIAAALSLCGCPGGETHGADGPAAGSTGVREREATKVIAARLERRDMASVLETTAVLEADRQVPIVARTAGQVVELTAEEGDSVKAGQVLARLDDRNEVLALRDANIALAEARHALSSTEVAIAEAESALATANNQLAQAERDLARDVELSGSSSGGVAAVSAKTLEQSRLARDQAAQDVAQRGLAVDRAKVECERSKTALSRAEVTRDKAQLALDHMSITAAFDGVVASRSIKIGQNLAGGETAFVLADPTDLRVVFYRPQRELAVFVARSAEELTIRATTEALPGLEFAGSVTRIAPVIDATSGSFRVTATMERAPLGDRPERLLPGMLLRLSIVTDRHVGALVAEKRAVVREGEQAFLFTVVDEGGQTIARRRFVREGYGDATHVEVTPLDADPVDGAATALPPLDVDTRVVVVGARDLSDGDPLEVLER
jgi:membrane fusion protein (multidrug efflux system)